MPDPIPFQIHSIHDLLAHIAFGNGAGDLQQAIGKRGFPMINMRDNAKVSNVHTAGVRHDNLTFSRHHGGLLAGVYQVFDETS